MISQLLTSPSPIRLSSAEWAEISDVAGTIRSEDTGVAGMLQVLDLDGVIYVREETPDRHILLRPRPTVEDAMGFVDKRLQSYERMWDG